MCPMWRSEPDDARLTGCRSISIRRFDSHESIVRRGLLSTIVMILIPTSQDRLLKDVASGLPYSHRSVPMARRILSGVLQAGYLYRGKTPADF